MNIAINEFSCTAGLLDNRGAAAPAQTFERTLDALELLLIEGGGVVSINGEPITVENHMLLFARPGERCALPTESRILYLRVMETDHLIAQHLIDWPRLLPLRNADHYALLISRIALAEEQNSLRGVASAMLDIAAYLEEQISVMRDSGRRLTEKTLRTVRMAAAYMDEHFREKCSLAEVAAYVGRSPIYFHDTFEEVTGKSPCEYISALRLGEAKRLLAFTELEPAEIAEKAGYGSQSYFNYAFKKATGTTPLAYRREAGQRYWKEI